MSEIQTMYSSYFVRYLVKDHAIELKNIRRKKGELVRSSMQVGIEKIKNLPTNLEENDEITF